MGVFTWKKEKLPKGLPVTQVYGIIFSDDGKVLLLGNDNRYNLSGGHTEKFDKTLEDTLKRELFEEMNIQLKNIHYLGYLLVREKGKPEYAQARMIAQIKDVGQVRPDLDNGKTYKRLLACPRNVKKYLNYEEEGEKMVDDAILLASQKFKFKPLDETEKFI